jgi:hypothetical protein
MNWAFTNASIHNYFDQATRIIVDNDADGFARCRILNRNDFFRILIPVNFSGGKCPGVDQKYDMYDWELLAIVVTLKHCRQNHEGANHKVLIQWHPKNFNFSQTPKVLSWRQPRWGEILSVYDFVIEHMEGKKHAADG